MTGLALVAALSLAAAGCAESADRPPSAGASTDATAAAAQPGAVEELRTAVDKLNDDTVRVTLDGGAQSGSGVLDPRAGTAQMDLKMGLGGQSLDIQFVRVQNDLYLKAPGLDGGSDKWRHVDATKIAPDSNLNGMLQGDLAVAENTIDGIVEVRRDGERRYSGTVDLTRSPTANKESVRVLGEQATAVPFTAAVDEQGRLTELTIDMSVLVSSLGTLRTSYSDFGAPVTVRRPAASETAEAPAELLRLFDA